MRLIPLLSLFYVLTVSAAPTYEHYGASVGEGENPSNGSVGSYPKSTTWIAKRSTSGNNYNGSRHSFKSAQPEAEEHNDDDNGEGEEEEEWEGDDEEGGEADSEEEEEGKKE
ncbi:hypothetical protein K493DRAFT_301603 [Basidiobolus meristosporus CBS 931.73]|uniref:Uncharacterized protein n=1 Tax=Basidiobolus meristosporus CBS 931.73 TaxID=1314790 RepID=A0A1Y1YBB2_9FUNG|nr:hypothetical protein K493DRAFT_301603 [Basidiobolus meristosporus CBS 931.73]|eukprot:ORX95242.1 hypothetical protein K493DRAFT_301603 [Basidiobolus meristosporus CBS 931.73]